jgi:FkbM family methyltransferase
MKLPSSTRKLLKWARPRAIRLFNWASGKPPATAEADFTHSLLTPKRMFHIRDRNHWESECRRMTMNARLSGDEILCRTLGRYKMIVNAGDKSLAPNLIADGYWEIWITALIARAVEPGMVCIDAGANIGYYTVLMAEHAGPLGKCISAEPVPETFSYLKKNALLNFGNMELLNLAFGAERGTLTLFMPRGEPKNASVSHVGELDQAHYERMDVQVQPIDDLDLPRLDFVKIDVEGAERLVWDGMQATIARSPDIQIVMEVNAQRTIGIEDWLQEISAIFPLCVVDYWGDPVSVTIEQIKADPHDVMLYLSKRSFGERLVAAAALAAIKPVDQAPTQPLAPR